MELADSAEPPLLPRVAGALAPLTAMQLRTWNWLTEQKMRSQRAVRQASVRIVGALDICLLRNSIEAVVHRHESLRTRIVVVDGVPRQQVDSAWACELEVINLDREVGINVESEAERVAEEFFSEEVDLVQGPLFAAKLLRLHDYDYRLLLGIDHIVSDGTSCGIIRKEIWTLYSQGARGAPLSLPRLRVQFADYALWQQATYEDWRQKHEPYWRCRLTGAPQLELPFDNGLLDEKEPMGVRAEIPLGRSVSAKLRELAWRDRTPLPIVVLAIAAAVLSRWCNQRDLVIPFVSHGRHGRPYLANMIGFLATLLYLRIEITETDSFVDLLRRVDREYRAALQHHDFGRVPDLIPECKSQIGFNWAPTELARRPVPQTGELHQIEIQPLSTPRTWQGRWRLSRYLGIVAFPDSGTDGEIVMSAVYGTDSFAHHTIESFGHNLRLFAETLTQTPHVAVAALDVMSI